MLCVCDCVCVCPLPWLYEKIPSPQASPCLKASLYALAGCLDDHAIIGIEEIGGVQKGKGVSSM
jgi:hypothetical protein